MRLLVDECVDERLRLLFAGYDCQTARFANLAGLKNGRLLEAAEAAGFDVLITVEREHSGSTKSSRTAALLDHSLRANQPAARSGATRARRGFRATFHRARRCCENQVGASPAVPQPIPGVPRTDVTVELWRFPA